MGRLKTGTPPAPSLPRANRLRPPRGASPVTRRKPVLPVRPSVTTAAAQRPPAHIKTRYDRGDPPADRRRGSTARPVRRAHQRAVGPPLLPFHRGQGGAVRRPGQPTRCSSSTRASTATSSTRTESRIPCPRTWQLAMVRSMPGCERRPRSSNPAMPSSTTSSIPVRSIRPLEVRAIPGLFFRRPDQRDHRLRGSRRPGAWWPGQRGARAGGSTGVNIDRGTAYIGVMIDDLVSNGVR